MGKQALNSGLHMQAKHLSLQLAPCFFDSFLVCFWVILFFKFFFTRDILKSNTFSSQQSACPGQAEK